MSSCSSAQTFAERLQTLVFFHVTKYLRANEKSVFSSQSQEKESMLGGEFVRVGQGREGVGGL